MENKVQKAEFFSLISPQAYHENLINIWLHLSRDGLVSRDDEEIFTDIGMRCVAHIHRTHCFPSYSEVVGWIPELYPQNY